MKKTESKRKARSGHGRPGSAAKRQAKTTRGHRPQTTAARPAAPKAARSMSAKPSASTRTAPAPTPAPVEAGAGSRAGVPITCPIVGIGASAGGLEALELFLKHLPVKSGMAFVVIQHLDPLHKGAMVELLQRAAAISVVEVTDRKQVQPDCVYVIPPNKDMSIERGVLHLQPQTSPRGLNLPIDYFFRSLAEDQQEGSIGVVLSGMGSDGTLGLRAIKEKAGAGFVQSLASAKFDSMPRSAIEAGLADVVAPPEELPARIIAYHQHAPYQSPLDAVLVEKQQSAFERVLVLLRARTGNDFSLYKKSTVYRRIERRMGLHQIDRIGNYVRYLRENPHEIELLFKELLIGVTSFFRDLAVWESLRLEVIPDLLRTRGQGSVRAWVPGCSTGEEAYSLAIVLKEALDRVQPARSYNFQIFATDLDKDAIERARQAIYPANIAADVSPERLRRFFVQEDRGFRVGKEIREMVVFAPQNITMDPPFTKLDFLSCRNLLIYLSPELQKKLIPLFHYALNPGGLLYLGSAETVGSFANLFTPVDGKSRLYRRLESAMGVPAVEFPASFVATPVVAADGRTDGPDASKAPPANLQLLADRVIVQRFSPAAILINDNGDILYISGRTGKYLEPAVGKANLNLYAMAREGLRYELSSAVAAALKQEPPVLVRGIKVRTNGSVQTVDLTVQKLVEPKEIRGTLMVVLTDVPPGREGGEAGKTHRAPAGPRTHQLETELQQAREEVQTTREEMQTSQEELKSTNEELQSTNEELQSSNEELTTSKEEMQSMNEELQTVNHELQSKVDELSRSNNDMKNLLNSTDIATLFLDGELLVRRFTTQTSKLIKLIATDAGRPITDIATDLEYLELADDAREVLRTLVFKEKQVATRDGRWFTVRIMPYRTLENVIDGVVITFTDVTATKLLEETLREQASQLRQTAEALPNLSWGCRPDGTCNFLSRQWVEYTGISEAEQLGYGWLERVHPDDRERFREEWKLAVGTERSLDAEIRIRARDGKFRWFKTRSVPIRDRRGVVVHWYGAHTDIDEFKRAAESRDAAAERLSRLLEWVGEPLLVLDTELRVACFNSAAERALGPTHSDLLNRPLLALFPETAGPELESKLREAMQTDRDTVFNVSLSTSPWVGEYSLLIHPHPEGLSILFKRLATAGT